MEMASVSPDAPPLDTKTDDEEKEPKIKPASFSELFQFATCGDLLTLFVGYFFAFGGGAGNPLMLLALQVYWFWLILKVAIKLITTGKVEDVRSDSEDEADAPKKKTK